MSRSEFLVINVGLRVRIRLPPAKSPLRTMQVWSGLARWLLGREPSGAGCRRSALRPRHDRRCLKREPELCTRSSSSASSADPDRHRCGFGVFAIMPFRDPIDKRSSARLFRWGSFRQGSSECWERAARSVLVVSRARHARGVRGAARREADFGSTPWRIAQRLRLWRVACIDVVAG